MVLTRFSNTQKVIITKISLSERLWPQSSGIDELIHVDFVPWGLTINRTHDTELLKKMNDTLFKECHEKLRWVALLQQDNTGVHISTKTRVAADECDFELLQHPPYSPDLAPSDFHWFPNLNIHLHGVIDNVLETTTHWRMLWTGLLQEGSN